MTGRPSLFAPVFALLVLPAAAYDDQPAASVVYAATHNSYSGNLGGERGSILAQLDGGVRFLEFDIHDNGYGDAHDYQLGHGSPGNEVDHGGGNPASNKLRDWLAPVADWSARNPDQAGVVVMLDLKDDLTDNPSYATGNLAALNDELASAFGARLFPASAAAAGLPLVGALRGKVLCLLSGDGGSRRAYRRDVGRHPAVALNAQGRVVEVHDSGDGALWYWSGVYGADGRVTWQRHGRYDTGQTPAVALTDDGYLVEVHQSEDEGTLWYHVGRVGADGEITWSPSRRYDNGILPTLRFTGSSALREIHRSETHNQNWFWQGTLNRSNLSVAWNTSTHGTTSDPRYDVATSSVGAASVSVSTGADGASPTDTLRYGTDRVAGERIRYQQRAFVEFQDGDDAELREGAWFYGAPASHSGFIVAARGAGRLVRGWGFGPTSPQTSPPATYAATDTPWADWYATLLAQNGAVK